MIGSWTSLGLWTAGSRSLADVVLAGLGVGSALAAASFATYMVAIGPHPRVLPPGGGDFPVFSTFDARPRDADPAETALRDDPTEPRSVAESAAMLAAGIDYTPTGSIGDKPATRDAPADRERHLADGTVVLNGYTLRDVFDGKAVVDARNKLTIVTAGSTIDGLGPVRAIRREGPNWVVDTAGGLIGP